MQYAHAHAEDFLRLQEVTDVGTAVAAGVAAIRALSSGADRALAALFDRTMVELILLIEQIDLSLVRIHMTMTSVS